MLEGSVKNVSTVPFSMEGCAFSETPCEQLLITKPLRLRVLGTTPYCRNRAQMIT